MFYMALIARKVMILLLITMISPVRGCNDVLDIITARNEAGEKLVSVMLPANAAGDQAWTYSVIGGNGRISESSTEAYEEYLRERWDSPIVDFVVPGYMPFIFEGEAAGEVTLKFSYTDRTDLSKKPTMMQIVSLKVYDDKMLAVSESYPVDISKSVIAVLLPSDAVSGGEWSYTAKGAGRLAEASWDEYQEQEMARRESEDEDDDMVLLPEGIPPGSAAFVFRGTKTGIVDLLFVCSEPAMEKSVKIEVFSDKTLAVIQPQQR